MDDKTAPPVPTPASPLVGRERELAILRAALEVALAGRGSLVLVGGEAGIGKTALAEALLAEAQEQGALALVGRCYDLAETPPYGPWAELFARAPRADASPPDFGGGGTASPVALFTAVRDFLGALAATSPLILLLDDLHWADPASLDLLRVVARGLADLPLVLLATYRADELTRRHPLYALLPLLVREARALRLDLRPLDEAGLRAFVAPYRLAAVDADRLVAYLDERAEGNPLFAGELVRTLDEDGTLRCVGDSWALGPLDRAGVPPLLRQVVDARVDRLGESARDLLGVAATLGPLIPPDLWATVAGATEGVLEATIAAATAAGLLVEDLAAGGYRFAHALIREALYDSLALTRRRAWHRRAGEALAAAPAPDPERVAHHLRRAGDPRAAEWLVRAGERAARAYAWLTAAERYEAALEVQGQEGGDPRERARLLLTLAQLWRYEDRHRGVGYLDEAERLAGLAGDAGLNAAARFDRAHLRLLADDARAAAERPAALAAMAAALPALEALPVEERAGLPALRLQHVDGAELYHRGALVYWLAWVGDLAGALTLAAPLLTGAPGTTARGLAGLGLAYHQLGRPEEAERALGAARAVFDAAGQQYEVFYRLADHLLVAYAYYPDQPARWIHLLEGIEDAARRAADAGHVASSGAQLQLLALRGDWARVRRLGGTTPQGAVVARRQGESDLAAAILGRAFPLGLPTEPGGQPLQGALECQREAARLAIDAADLPRAHAWLAAHDRWLAWSGAVLGPADGHLAWADYHRAAGDLAAARGRAERALAHASDPRQPLALLAARRTLGELDTASGHHVGARTHLDAALALAEACVAPYERALTLLALAELHAVERRHDAATTELVEARALLGPLEARPALARADALAARLAASASTSAALPFGLTAREAEVLRLVAAGLTDAQVAERLFLSPYTVKAHLRAVYGKLGVPSRTAAARLALEHGLA